VTIIDVVDDGYFALFAHISVTPEYDDDIERDE
jgi:hypothetical protein